MIRDTVDSLPAPGPLALDHLPRTLKAHDAELARVPAMNLIEVGGDGGTAPLPLPLKVGAWNLERCLDPEGSAAHVADCDLLLLSEMDSGMARTAQRNTTAEVARLRGMSYAYAVEFLELGLGNGVERDYCTDDFNARGFHGNALMARGALKAPFALRLYGQRQWFTSAEEPRLGERLAIGAVVETEAGPFLAVSTHLESACGPDHRHEQMRGLIDMIDALHPGLPVLIGGDLNTGNHNHADWRAEGLFDLARRAGFAVHGGGDEVQTTRPSRLTRFPERAMKLDWLFTRGMVLEDVEIRPSLGPDGVALSDHDAILGRISALES